MAQMDTQTRRSRYKQRILSALCLIPMLGLSCLCRASQPSSFMEKQEQSAQKDKLHVFITVGNHRFAVTLAPSEAARVFAASLPITLSMAELNGNEKHGDLQKVLPTHENRPGTIQTGDVLLWGSRTVVIFYKTFQSPYSYTTLGRIADPAGLANALGSGDVRVVFSQE